MSIWDDLYVINEAKSAKELVSEMSQEISMKPKKDDKQNNASNKKKSSDDDLFTANEFEDKKLNKDADTNNDGKVSNAEAVDDTIDDLDNVGDPTDEELEDDEEDDFSDIETDLPDDVSDEDLDNMDMDDELTNSDSMLDGDLFISLLS